MQPKNYHVIVVTKDAASVLAPFQGHLTTTLVSGPTGKVAHSLGISTPPQTAHFRQGRVTWSKPPKQNINDATAMHIRELGFKGVEDALRKPLDKELTYLKSLTGTQGCTK